MLYECAAHGTRVCSLEVLYIGWNANGSDEHLVAVGWKRMWAKPLLGPADIEPTSTVSRSFTIVSRPSLESRKVTSSVSPELKNATLSGSGVNVGDVTLPMPANAISGSAGAIDLPFLVKNAKLMVSSKTLLRQSSLLKVPVF